MKLGRILAISLLIVILAAALGCSAQTSAQQQTTVTRGDLTVRVTLPMLIWFLALPVK
jgi:hypothetical protein